MIKLSYGIKIRVPVSFVLSQIMRVMDGRWLCDAEYRTAYIAAW